MKRTLLIIAITALWFSVVLTHMVDEKYDRTERAHTPENVETMREKIHEFKE